MTLSNSEESECFDWWRAYFPHRIVILSCRNPELSYSFFLSRSKSHCTRYEKSGENCTSFSYYSFQIPFRMYQFSHIYSMSEKRRWTRLRTKGWRRKIKIYDNAGLILWCDGGDNDDDDVVKDMIRTPAQRAEYHFRFIVNVLAMKYYAKGWWWSAK